LSTALSYGCAAAAHSAVQAGPLVAWAGQQVRNRPTPPAGGKTPSAWPRSAGRYGCQSSILLSRRGVIVNPRPTQPDMQAELGRASAAGAGPGRGPPVLVRRRCGPGERRRQQRGRPWAATQPCGLALPADLDTRRGHRPGRSRLVWDRFGNSARQLVLSMPERPDLARGKSPGTAPRLPWTGPPGPRTRVAHSVSL